MSQFKRTGAFIGTVATGIAVAKIVRPRKGPAVIDAAGNVFRNSLYAAMGGDMRAGRDNPSVAQYQRGGNASVNIQAVGDVHINSASEARTMSPKQVPYLWSGIYYRLLSLFPQVTTPYVVDWHRWVELMYGEDWEDASLDWAGIEHFGNLVGELRESYECR